MDEQNTSMEIEQLQKKIQDQAEQIRQLMAKNSILQRQLQQREEEKQIQLSPVTPVGGEQSSSATGEQGSSSMVFLREQVRIQTTEQAHWPLQQQHHNRGRGRGTRRHGYRRRQNRRHNNYWMNQSRRGGNIYIYRVFPRDPNIGN